MSFSLLDETAQLRWWSESEIAFRELSVSEIHRCIVASLRGINKAWSFERIEGPTLIPRTMVAPGYTEDDLWCVKAQVGPSQATMRPETTSTSYLAAQKIIGPGSDKERSRKLPLCVWQVGKSFRRESTEGASASKLRFFEFTQAEWQCIYGLNTMADYRAAILPDLEAKIGWLVDRPTRIVPSDRLPGYSLKTDDIEVDFNGRWTEVASISSRTDFPEANVLEIAVGADRIVDVASQRAVKRAQYLP